MTQQLDMFQEPVELPPDIIGQGNTLVLVAPRLVPTDAEALERRAARQREIDDRKAAKTFENILNGQGPRRWEVTA